MPWAFGDILLDAERFELTLFGQSERVEPQVLSVLIHLIRHRDSMVTKDELVASVCMAMRSPMPASQAASALPASPWVTMARVSI